MIGDFVNFRQVTPLVRRATVKGYRRVATKYGYCPAAIESENEDDCVDGYLLKLETGSQLEKLDDFAGGVYQPLPVIATVDDPGEEVDAEIYVWDDRLD